MNDVQEIKQLSGARLSEANVLVSAGHPAGAYYLAGYSAELMLKARVCHLLDVPNFFLNPPKMARQAFLTHDLEQLLTLSGLRSKLERDGDPNNGGSAKLLENWSKVVDWSENARYQSNITMTDAQMLLHALTDPNHGVLTWLAKQF